MKAKAGWTYSYEWAISVQLTQGGAECYFAPTLYFLIGHAHIYSK